jgi:hypothetical protein
VHAATAIRDRSKRQAGHWIVAADVEINRGSGKTVRASSLTEYVPDYASGLPGRKTLRELLRVLGGITGDLESFDGQHRRRGVMTVTAAAWWYWKTCDNDVGPEFADDADDVGEDLLAVPELKRFLG